MPAAPKAAPSIFAASQRLLVVGLAIVLLVTAMATIATPAEAGNWSSQIAATRRSQLAYESMMLGADRQLRSLGRALKQARRKVKRADRRIPALRERRDAARERLSGMKTQLQAARLALRVAEAQREAAALTAAGLGTSLMPPLPSADRELWRDGRAEPPAEEASATTQSIPTSLSLFAAQDPDLGTAAWTGPPSGRLVVVPANVRDLERSVRKQSRRLHRLGVKTRRAERQKRASIRRIAGVKRARRAVKSRRAGAEAALKSRIVGMSNLAERRALKKSKMRPGRNTGFVWPTRGRLSQGYGCTGSRFSAPRGGCAHFHGGIDIAAGHGAAIRAAGVGVVSYVGRNPWDRGKRAFMVVVAHAGGYETLYAHVLPIRRVRVGQVVRRGQVIAYMGSTGHSTGTHLHFEIRRGYSTINPLAFL